MNQLVKDQKIGRYSIIDPKFGNGASGDVCLVADDNGNQGVMKFLPLANRPVLIEQFKSEYQYLLKLEHPHLAKALDFGFYKETFYLVTEYLEGKNFFESTYHLPFEKTLSFFLQVLDGLDYIHRNGFVHLDIKPENIIISGNEAKIIDLGAASAVSNFKNMRQGTFPFIAPEIALGSKNIDGRADMFSFAATAHYCLTRGDLPFLRRNRANKNGNVDFDALEKIIENETIPDPISKYRRNIPEYIDTIILRLLAKNPDERFYGNARAVINALATHLPDAFVGVRGNYLLPPQDIFVSNGDELKEIMAKLEYGKSSSLLVLGKRGFGKTRFLNVIKHKAELMSDKWFCTFISLPASSMEIETWLSRIQIELSENGRGVVVLVDDIDNLSLCEVTAREKFEGVFNNLLSSVSERQKRPELFENACPLLAICASESDNATPPIYKVAMNKVKVGENEEVDIINLKPFGIKELKQYLELIPALMAIKIKPAWMKLLHEVTGGVPGSVEWVLKNADISGRLFEFDADGNIHFTEDLPVPETPPPLTENRLIDEYLKLSDIEKKIVNLMSAWCWKGLTRPITYEDISNFIYSSSLVQNIENLETRGILKRLAFDGRKKLGVTFFNSYLPLLIYKRIPQKDREAIHDQIAGYLKSDKDSIVLHKGYGSDKSEAVRNLVMLGKKELYQRGHAEFARKLFEDALSVTTSACFKKIIPYVYFQILSSLYYSGRYSTVYEKYEEVVTKFNIDQNTYYEKYWRVRLDLIKVQVLLMNQEYDDAKKIIEKSRSICKEHNWKVLNIIFDNYEAHCFYGQSFIKPTDAKNLLLRAKDCYEASSLKEKSLHKSERNRVINNDLGMVMKKLGEYRDAEKHLMDKHNRLTAMNMVFDKIAVLTVLADTCRYSKYYDDAEKFGLEAFRLAKEIKNERWLSYSSEMLLNLYHSEDKFLEALDAANKCISTGIIMSGAEEYKHLLRRVWIKMGHCYKELKQYNKAILFLESGIAKKFEDIYSMSAHVGLSETYFYKKDFSCAKKHLNRAEKLMGSLSDESHSKRIRELKELMAEKNISSLA